jgi:hypothetical protein
MEFEYIRCPNCKQRVRSYYDIKTCAYCGKGICPRCSIKLQNGASVCYKCAGMQKGKLERKLEKANYISQMFFYVLFGPKWVEKPKPPIDPNEYY